MSLNEEKRIYCMQILSPMLILRRKLREWDEKITW